MESEEKGFEPSPKHMDDVDASLRFLPSSCGKKLKKKKLSRKTTLVIGLVIMVALITLFVALFVWIFHLRTDLKEKKVFTGSMTISNKIFTDVYEDSSSTQFKQLSSLVTNQMKDIYSGVPELSKHYLSSSVQGFSESSDDSVIAYYLSEFSVPESQISDVVKAIMSTEQIAPRLFQRQSRGNKPTNTLLISSLTSAAVDARLINSTLRNRYKESYHCREGQTGIIQSPGFPHSPYRPNTYAEWQLRADPNHRVRLELTALDLEDDCRNDFIRIYDTLVPAESQVMAEKCGNLHPNKELVFLSSGNVMLVTLVTNGEDNFPGFRAKYSQVASEILGCGGKLSGMQGSFTSPGFPACYPPQIQCVWDIEVPTGKHVMLNFSMFSMHEPEQSSNNCLKDYVEIKSNRVCGEKPTKKVLSFKTNKLEVKFYSDKSYVDDGFSAQFEAFEPVDLCPGSFQCDNDVCISTKLQCDGYNDCGDMSDERNCVCELSDISCKNGFCKPKHFLCDGLNDCGDNTDEENCGHCKPGEIVCRNGRCVSDQKKCDGHDDCEDGTDESDCEKSVVVSCSEFTFRCKNDVCISKQNPRCDGDLDCEDGSDETDCNCGTRPYKSLQIVGGVEATEGEWPWQVSLHLQNEGHVCGASLISNLWLITAAHCIQGANSYSYPEQWQVYLGLHSQGHAGTWTVRKKLNQIICHPDYNPSTNNNDIALMELESPVTLNQYIWPICLPSATRMLPAGQPVWIAGWGKIRAQGKLSTVLREAEVRVVNSTVCAELIGDEVTPQMICAGVLSGGVDACQGDSGGQLSYLDPVTGRSFLVGVVSWGRGCGLKGKPGVYTRVSKFRSWIHMESGV